MWMVAEARERERPRGDFADFTQLVGGRATVHVSGASQSALPEKYSRELMNLSSLRGGSLVLIM